MGEKLHELFLSQNILITLDIDFYNVYVVFFLLVSKQIFNSL